MRVDDKLYAFNIIAEIQEICKPLKELGVNFFNYVRFYNDGSITILTTQGDWLKFCLENERPRVGNILDLTDGIYFWQDIFEKEVICDAKNSFNICKGMQFMNITSEYRDVYAFASENDSDYMLSYYFNNMDLFQKFILYFLDKTEDLFRQADKNRIVAPDAMKIPSIEHDMKKLSRIKFMNRIRFQSHLNGEKLKLSQQQMSCLNYLSMGYTAKEIGQILDISHRTVETYIIKIKEKLKCETKPELIYKHFTTIAQGNLNALDSLKHLS